MLRLNEYLFSIGWVLFSFVPVLLGELFKLVILLNNLLSWGLLGALQSKFSGDRTRDKTFLNVEEDSADLSKRSSCSPVPFLVTRNFDA